MLVESSGLQSPLASVSPLSRMWYCVSVVPMRYESSGRAAAASLFTCFMSSENVTFV